MSLGTSGTVYAVSQRRPADPTGTVAGFADARGDWLPLACTLNCTLAVDRVATLLGLDREAVEPGTAVTLLPFLDGERTPNLPNASGLLHGLRHDTTAGQLLQAAYDGAVHSLLGALDLVLDEDADPSAPLLLIGGGARGTAWQQTVRRLSGRPVQVPEAKELVALGAAAQAAGVLTGEDPAAVARRWNTAAGPVLDAVERDEETLARIAGVLSDAAPLLERPTDTH
jgi:xylulokinase